MRHPRVDYRMARRATLRDVAEGLRTPADVCDAHPELLRAGQHLGTPADAACPICKDAEALRHVTYIFPLYGPKARRGQAVPRESVGEMMKRLGSLDVYTVEVCIACGWHHLVERLDVKPRPSAASGQR